MTSEKPTPEEKEINTAWNQLKYRCKDVGGSHVKLEVSIGDFKTVLGKLLKKNRNDYKRGFNDGKTYAI